MSCATLRLLKRDYESALREEALYDHVGKAPFEHAIRHRSEAIAASALAKDRFVAYLKNCPICEKNRTR